MPASPQIKILSTTLTQVPREVYLRRDHMARTSQTLDEAFLLSEAIRFYNYGITQGKRKFYKNRFVEKKIDPIDQENITKAIRELGSKCSSGIFALLERLDRNREFQAQIPNERQTEYIKALLTDWYGAAHLRPYVLTSAEWRTKSKSASVIAFDQIAQLSGDVQAKLQANTVKKCVVDSYYSKGGMFSPWIGGDKALSPSYQPPPRDRELQGTDLSSWNEIFYETLPSEAGLTEKLFAQIACEIYIKSHQAITARPRIEAMVDGNAMDPYWKATLDLEQKINAQFDLLEGTNKQRSKLLINKWLDNLRPVEALFDDAIRRTKDEDGSRRWVILFDKDASCRVGLYWALYLSSYLRAYLLRIKIAVLLASVPYERVYNQINGYMGVALWESIRGGAASHFLFNDGCLNHAWSIPFVRKSGETGSITPSVNDFNPAGANGLDFHMKDFWQNLQDKEATVVHSTAHEELMNLAISNHGYNMDQSLRDLLPIFSNKVKVSDFPFLARRNPVIRDELLDPASFGIMRGIISTNKAKSASSCSEYRVRAEFAAKAERVSVFHTDSVFGAHFVAQAHLYVAAQLLRIGLRTIYGDSEPVNHVDYFTLIAGSFLWSGKFPPHITHRDGYCFDLDFIGVKAETNNLNQWPVSLLDTDLAKSYQSQMIKEKTEGQYRLPWLTRACAQFAPKEPRWLPTTVLRATKPLEVTKEDSKSRRLVLRELMRDLITKETSYLYNWDTQRKQAEEIASEKRKYEELESRLAGTPLHASRNQNRIFHLAHLAVVLSFPIEIIWGSPLVHVRCLRAIQSALGHKADELFQPSVQLLKQGTTDKYERKKIKLDFPRFAFLPQNHHNHWHISYWFGDSIKMERWRKNYKYLDEQVTSPLIRFKQCFPLWQQLGVALAPLVDYLNNYKEELNKAELAAAKTSVGKATFTELTDALSRDQGPHRDLAELIEAVKSYEEPAYDSDGAVWYEIDKMVQPAKVFDDWIPHGTMLFDAARCTANYLNAVKNILQPDRPFEEIIEDEIQYMEQYGLDDSEEYRDGN